MKTNFQRNIILFITLYGSSLIVQAYDILFVAGFTSRSHMIAIWPILDDLHSRGHNVTVITPYTDKGHLGIEQIQLVEAYNEIEEKTQFLFEIMTAGAIGYMMMEKNVEQAMGELFYQNSVIKRMIRERPKYDLILTDTLFNYHVLPFASLLDAPIVQICTTIMDTRTSYFSLAPTPYAVVPNMFTNFYTSMSFPERLMNTVISTVCVLLGKYMEYITDSIASHHIPGIASVSEARKNVSLVLTNSDSLMDVPRPFLPNTIRIGGIQCQDSKPLPKDLEDFIQSSAEDGFVFFSLGSVFNSIRLPNATQRLLLRVFGKMKQKVLWKFEGEIKDVPSNVELVRWAPQQDLLGHPKMRLFMTHGGMLSLQEALYHAVPTLIFPVFAEQLQNSARAKDLGFAESLNIFDLTEEEITRKANQLMTEKRYKKAALKLSSIFRDRPQSDRDLAVYWLEYVIRHQGAKHLQTSAVHLNFYQYFLLDVLFIIFVMIIAIAAILTLLCRICISVFWKLSKSKPKTD